MRNLAQGILYRYDPDRPLGRCIRSAAGDPLQRGRRVVVLAVLSRTRLRNHSWERQYEPQLLLARTSDPGADILHRRVALYAQPGDMVRIDRTRRVEPIAVVFGIDFAPRFRVAF